MPDVFFDAGTPVYMQDESTFFKFVQDTMLYMYTPDTAMKIDFTFEGNNLRSSVLNVDGMYSETLFPVENNTLFTLTRNTVTFYAKGWADGVVVFYGDSIRNESHKYSSYPLAVGDAVPINETDSSGTVSYYYLTAGEYTATMVATNFWATEADYQEQNVTMQVIVLDKTLYPFIN